MNDVCKVNCTFQFLIVIFFTDLVNKIDVIQFNYEGKK